MKFYCVQHVGFEGPAALSDWALAAGHQLELLRADQLTDWPDPLQADGIIILGGPMSVHDSGQLAWLAAEKIWLQQAIASGVRCLGLCLGGQLLAEALGGQVTRNAQPEIGWFDIELTAAAQALPGLAGLSRLPVLHWHGETFSLPPGAQCLATSAACQQQGFLWRDQVLAFQCHPEANRAWLEALIAACGHELQTDAPYVQSGSQMLSNADFSLWSKPLTQLLNGFFSREFGR